MAVTIKDVAARAGVSPSTVSRVCNNNPSISRETRERVQKAIEELGYELPAPQEQAVGCPVRHIAIVLPTLAIAYNVSSKKASEKWKMFTNLRNAQFSTENKD